MKLKVNMMLGGYDLIDEKPRLHMLDYFGADIECPYGAHGYGAMFTMSILDRHYNKYDSFHNHNTWNLLVLF